MGVRVLPSADRLERLAARPYKESLMGLDLYRAIPVVDRDGRVAIWPVRRGWRSD